MFQGIRRPFLFLLFAVVFFPLKAQKYNGNSPYSQFGLGDINPQGTVRNIGMGDVGVSMPAYGFINNFNPALLPANKFTNFDSAAPNYTMIDAAGLFTMRRISTTQNIGVDASLYEAYLNYAFPVSPNWVANLGLQPYSLVAYKSSTRGSVTNNSNNPAIDTNTVLYSYTGSGGLYKVYVGNGIDISRKFSVGLEIGYLFGNGSHISSSQIQVYNKYIESSNNNSTYNGISLKPGFAYRTKLFASKFEDSTVYFNAGFTSEIFPVLRVIYNDYYQRFDTLNNLSVSSSVEHHVFFLKVPSTYRGGFSIDKPGKWNFGVDFNYSNWNKYQGVADNTQLYSSYGVAIGGEYYMQKQEEHKRMIFRSGFSYNKTPITLNNTVINDYALTIGGTFPIGRIEAADRKKPLSKINFALVFGDRGTTKMNLVKDYYFKLYVGFIINDRWFARSKVE